MGLVLASRSPQRRALLDQIRIPHRVVVPEVDEIDVGDPEFVVRTNSSRKATAVASPGDIVLGVDTVVVLDETIHGKPSGSSDAAVMLRALRGREHRVLSGVTLVVDGRSYGEAAQTIVQFRAFADEELEWYLASGEWRNRAGGYAIQGAGASLVERIDGDYTNVVGLPVPTLLDLVDRAGIRGRVHAPHDC